MLSLIVPGKRFGSCGIYPIFDISGTISFPFLSLKIIDPCVGFIEPKINLNKVDFPAPESPVNKIFSPDFI